ncbi:IQ domain-containing protein E isoform X2 [Ascaphus truei]|uniref:IQ domain-containing protein E isoform X2 n=1 Tax=Ascaphus truei TaxID=8439 RepID=UPI003F5A45A5
MSWVASESGTEAEELQLEDDGVSAITYESDTERKVKKKKTSNLRSPKSPYLSSTNLYPKKAAVWRSLKGTGLMHSENPMAKVPRQLWLASLKHGNGLTQPLRSDIDIGQAWANPSSSTPEYLKEALGMKKPKHSRSASSGYIPGTPDYKEKEDMYDQIIDLKKMLQAQKSEGDIMKTKLRRLEEENSRKDRQIEQLLDPSRSSEFARSLVEKRSDGSLVVNNLKQKILKLEKQCKEKDTALGKLQTELKTTSLEEMKVAMETYYEEIQRLQILLANARVTERRSSPESRDSQKRQKVLNAAVLRLSKQIKELQDENQSLKADLDRALANSPTSNRTKGHSDWSKQRMGRRIAELEKLEKPRSPSAGQEQLAQVSRALTTGQGDGSLDPKSDLRGECERLKNLVKKLKGDRESLQTLLGTKDSDVKKLQQEKTNLERQLQGAQDRSAEREEIKRLNQKIKKLEAEREDEKRGKEEYALKALKKKESQESRPNSASYANRATSRPLTANSTGGSESRRTQEAAQLIQKNWKLYKSKRDGGDLDEAAVLLQASLRGHLVRQKMLLTTEPSRSQSPRANRLPQQDSSSSPDGSQDEDDTVSFLQSAFRAHLARTNKLGHSEVRGRQSPGKSSPLENARSPIPRKFSSQDGRYSLAGESSGAVSEDCIEELTSEEEAEPRRPRSLNLSSQRPLSGKKGQPVEEPHSDDSDDIIVVSPTRPARRKDSDF